MNCIICGDPATLSKKLDPERCARCGLEFLSWQNPVAWLSVCRRRIADLEAQLEALKTPEQQAADMYALLGQSALDEAKQEAALYGVGCVLIANTGNVINVVSVDITRIRMVGTSVVIDASEVIQEAQHRHQIDGGIAELRGPNGERYFPAQITQEGDFSG